MKPNQDKHKGNHNQIFHNQLLKAADKILKAREEMIHYIDVNNDTISEGYFFFLYHNGGQKTTEWHVQNTRGKRIQLRINLYPVKIPFKNEVEIN